MPIQRRLPKRGFKNPDRVEYQVVDVGRLAAARGAARWSIARWLEEQRLVRAPRPDQAARRTASSKVALTVRVDAASEAATQGDRGGGRQGRDVPVERRRRREEVDMIDEAPQHLPGPRAQAPDPVHAGAVRRLPAGRAHPDAGRERARAGAARSRASAARCSGSTTCSWAARSRARRSSRSASCRTSRPRSSSSCSARWCRTSRSCARRARKGRRSSPSSRATARC